MVDIVYPLGPGSRWSDNELRFSLRSVQAYVHNPGNIYIIGHCPPWVQNVIHIPATDHASFYHKAQNIYNKIVLACQQPAITENFLFFNDDFFLLQPLHTSQLPYYYHTTLHKSFISRPQSDLYAQTLKNTYTLLSTINATTKNFDCHAPIIYNKTLFIQHLQKVNFSIKNGYAIKSLYANMCAHTGHHLPDCKINEPLGLLHLIKLINGRPFFSCNDRALASGSLKEYLHLLYPNKSQYEK